MTIFSRKAVSSIETLGEKLRRLRDEAHLSLPTIAKETGIQQKYLEALEQGAYAKLPGDVYVRNILRHYVQLLHLNEQRVFEIYDQERTVVRTTGMGTLPPQAKKEARSFNPQKLLKRLALGVAALALVGYLGYTVMASRTPPALTVSSPAQDIVLHELVVQVQGTTERESRVKINGQDILLDAEGKFSENVDLQPGLNVITVTSAKERTREQKVERRVIVDLSTGDGVGN